MYFCKSGHDKQAIKQPAQNKLPCRWQNVQKKQLKTCFQMYRVKEGDEIYNYLTCPSFDDLLVVMYKKYRDDQHSPCIPYLSSSCLDTKRPVPR